MEPAQIDRYEIHALLGQGGMGTVYKARDPLMERWVAIKTVTVQDTRQRARFQQEVRAAGKFNHPHIITVYDVGEQDELAYIVMELVEGETLAGRLSAPIPWSEAVELLLPICQALAYAHNQGVIHRDVKPANILISSAGQVKLTDFGVARLEATLRRITESGSIVGTPLYTAPEQLRNEAVDGRADLFSAGIVLFELITGQHPFPGETLPQVVYRITQPEPANLEPLAAVAPQPVVDLVGRALSKDPAARFVNIEEMAEVMERCLAQPDITLSPPSLPITAPGPTLSRPVIEIIPGDLRLSSTEELLLHKAFASHDRVYLEREFSGGYSGARVLLVTPVRSGGRRLAQVILKLDTPTAIDQEWRAYQKYVQDTLPPVTARILEQPLYAKEGPLALLRYTFAGGLGSAAPESLQTYYAQHPGQEVAALLEKNLFKSFGAKWWLQRQSDNLILRREYDRLLPVHLVITAQELSETMPTLRTLIAGQTSATACRELEVGRIVELQDFTVAEIEADQGQVTLQALPPSGYSTNPIRVRVTGLKAGYPKYQVGETIASFLGIVTATRRQLLCQRAEPAWPDQNLDQKRVAIGDRYYPNPLYDYEALLDQRVSAMRSIIHGDLNLQNILVTPGSGLVWLIDFATTREGHNLYDFMRLETQVITKLLPQTRAGPEAIIQIMYFLHQSDASPRQVPTQLQKPFIVLAAIRRIVRVCMYNREQWDEYYLGLVIMLLGALKFRELDPAARSLVLAAAAAVRGMITIPALQITPAPTPVRDSSPLRLWPKIAAVIGSLALFVTLTGSALWFSGLFSPDRSNSTPPAATTVAAIVSTKSPTLTASPTPTPSPSPTPPDHGEGIALSSVDLRSGPGFDYPALDAVTIGNAVQVTGRSADSKWLQIAFSSDPGEYGWVPAEFVKLTGVIVPRIATARPPPTMTFTPTPQPTATPTITPTPSPTPTVTLTPTATPTPCPVGLAAEFQALWNTYGSELGCPAAPLEVIPILAEEFFEGGHLFWRSDTDEVYVVYDRQRDDGAILTSGRWDHYPFPWDGTIPPGVGPTPPDRIEPQRGFGWLWRAKLGGPDGPLGWAMDKEYGFDNIGRVQPFENGRVFKGSDPKIYVLLDNGRFFVYDPAQGQ